jgi:hypothetical protein
MRKIYQFIFIKKLFKYFYIQYQTYILYNKLYKFIIIAIIRNLYDYKY